MTVCMRRQQTLEKNFCLFDVARCRHLYQKVTAIEQSEVNANHVQMNSRTRFSSRFLIFVFIHLAVTPSSLYHLLHFPLIQSFYPRSPPYLFLSSLASISQPLSFSTPLVRLCPIVVSSILLKITSVYIHQFICNYLSSSINECLLQLEFGQVRHLALGPKASEWEINRHDETDRYDSKQTFLGSAR